MPLGKVLFLSAHNLITSRDKIVQFTFEMSVNLAKQPCSFDPSSVCVLYIFTKGKRQKMYMNKFKYDYYLGK